MTIVAESAIAVEASGRVFYEKDADTVRDLYSVTKVLTAIVAREAGADLDAFVTVESTDAGTGLDDGDILSLRDLLYLALVPSNNRAAQVVARHIGSLLPGETSPLSRFGEAVNALYLAHGWSGASSSTVFYSEASMSARHAADMLRVAMQDEVLAQIMGTLSYSATVVGPNARTLPVSHTMAYVVSGFPEFVAAKTGSGDYKANLALAWDDTRGGTAITVIMHSTQEGTQRYDDAAEVNRIALGDVSKYVAPFCPINDWRVVPQGDGYGNFFDPVTGEWASVTRTTPLDGVPDTSLPISPWEQCRYYVIKTSLHTNGLKAFLAPGDEVTIPTAGWNPGGGTWLVLWIPTGATSNEPLSWFKDASTRYSIQHSYNDTTVGVVRVNGVTVLSPGTVRSLNLPIIHGMAFSAASGVIGIYNQNRTAANGSFETPTGMPATARVGARGDGTLPVNASIARIVIYDRVLTDDEISSAMLTLAMWYGLDTARVTNEVLL